MDNLISRRAVYHVLDCVKFINDDERRYAFSLMEQIEGQPERKTGKWIPHKSIFGGLGEKVYTCNQCGYNIGFHTENFCPNCGADMRTAKHGTKIDLCIMDEVEGRT